MKIGLCGNVANNYYNLAKSLRKEGCEAYLILDTKDDDFAMSHPIWEDVDCVIQTDLVMKGHFFKTLLEKMKKEFSWFPPSWVKEKKTKTGNKFLLLISFLFNLPRILITERSILIKIYETFKKNLILFPYGLLFFYLHWQTIKEMRKYDFLIVSNLAPIYAYLVNKPFIFFPCGADILIISRPGKAKSDKTRAALQKKALSSAKSSFTFDPHYLEVLEGLGFRGYFFLLPLIDLNKCRPQNVKLADLLDNKNERKFIEVAKDRFIFFVPSRQDFYWKGTDKLLRAYARLVREKEGVVFMVLAGWGEDIEKTKELIKELKIEKDLYLLPYTLSKPRLIKFYNTADAICDKFVTKPSYGFGTSTLEAMACAKPVITFIDIEKFRLFAPNFSPPLIFNILTEDEIFNQMKKLVENKKLCREIGQQSREWVIENYGEGSIKKFIKILEEIYQKSS